MNCLGFADVGCLWPLWSCNDVKGYTLTLSKGFEPFTVDGCVVNEDILPAVHGDETEAFCIIEPFYRSL